MTGERYAYATLERCVAFHHLHNPSARPSAADVATACHVAQRTVMRWRAAGGLTERQADRAACALGYNPICVWPEWGCRTAVDGGVAA